MRFVAQVNVTVGAFFALSGYVAAYTTTLGGNDAAKERFSPKKWWITKAMSYYPMHWFVLLGFGPLFVYCDVTARGWGAALSNGLLSVTLTQAWFPAHRAEIWNAPTWFLSCLVADNVAVALALPRIARSNQTVLRRTMVWLYAITLLPTVVYLGWIGSNGWRLVEGMTPPKEHPSYGLFNFVRFFPVFNAAETLMGAVACKMVLLESSVVSPGDADTATKSSPTNMAVAVPFGITVGILVGRAVGWMPDCSDLLVRKVFFLPMFLHFVMALHLSALRSRRNTNSNNAPSRDLVSTLLSNRLLVWLGSLSFPIYILHGPIGQVFYKRAIANKLWGGVLRGKGYFALYLALVLVSAMLVQKLFRRGSFIGGMSRVATAKIVDRFGSQN